MIRKYMKRYICLMVLAVTMIISCVSVVNAAEQRVYDQAHLFTAGEIKSLERRIVALKKRISYDVVIVTTSNAQGKSALEYADDFYDNASYDFGTGLRRSGVLLLLDMDNREIRISTSGDMIGILTDERIEQILDRIYSRMLSKEYKSAAEVFLGEVKRAAAPPKSMALAGFLIGIVISGITCAVISARYSSGRGKEKYAYQQKGTMDIIRQNDRFLDRQVFQRRIPKNPPPQSRSSSSGGHSSGRSTTHVSSSGRTHGGGGRKF